MPNRLIFSIRFFSKVFWKYTFIVLSMLAFFYLFRMNLYFLSIYHAVPEAVPMDILLSFISGMRFDLSLLAWMLLPLVLMMIVQAFFEHWSKASFTIHKIYLSVFWFVACGIFLIDFAYFAHAGKRAGLDLYQNLTFEGLFLQIEALPRSNGWIFLGISVLLLVLGLWLIWSLKFGSWKDEYSPHKGGMFEILYRIFYPLILIAIMAHGTYKVDSLSDADAQVSTFVPVNEMALNPLLNLSKQLFLGGL